MMAHIPDSLEEHKRGGKKKTEQLNENILLTCLKMTSLWLWLSTQDLHKIKPVQSSSKEGQEDPEAPGLADELWQLVGAGEGRISFP